MTPKIYSIVNGSSKGEEIDALGRLVEQFRQGSTSGSYLATLFTDELLKWCEGRITSDFTIDVMDIINSEGRQISALESGIAMLRLERADLEKKLAQLKDSCEQSRDELKADLEQARSETRAWASSYHGAQEDYAKASESLRFAQACVASLTAETIELKAKLYDLEHAVAL